jgi:ribosomal protein S18 acetylase RimI-like enzyme
MESSITRVQERDKPWVLQIIRQWGADFIVTRGRKVFPTEIEGFIAAGERGDRIGLVTFEIVGDQCEIVTLDAFRKFSGIGTALTNRVREAAIERGCERLWLITTNDNLDAIRFYQRRGFVIGAVYANAIAASRKLKPSIPEIGMHGIPIRDEIEFETVLRCD